MADADTYCGLPEHTHTSDCYAWVAPDDGTEELYATEYVDVTEELYVTEIPELSDGMELAEEVTEDVATETVDGTEIIEASENKDIYIPQEGDVREDGCVYTLICGMEEHTHTDICYDMDAWVVADADADAENILDTENPDEDENAVGLYADVTGSLEAMEDVVELADADSAENDADTDTSGLDGNTTESTGSDSVDNSATVDASGSQSSAKRISMANIAPTALEDDPSHYLLLFTQPAALMRKSSQQAVCRCKSSSFPFCL